MIIVNVNGEEHRIENGNVVSDGKYKHVVEHCVEMLCSDYKASDGFLEPYLFLKLSEFKSIKVVSTDFKFQKNRKEVY